MSVHLVNGGGMHNVDIRVDATKAEIINQLKAVSPQMEHVCLEYSAPRLVFPLIKGTFQETSANLFNDLSPEV